MKNNRRYLLLLLATAMLVSCSSKENKKVETKAEDPGLAIENTVESNPLPSWNDGTNKTNIINYVEDVTNKNSPNYIPVLDRIATFDNDGTLWSEKPVYFQLFFAIDRVKAMAADHPEWKSQQPYKAILEDNMEDLKKQGMKGIEEIIMSTHAGITTDEFAEIVTEWFATAKHPTKKVHYNELIFQPMVELLEYLRANDFKTFIVSGGGIEFMRPITQSAYGIPSDQVVGSSIATEWDDNNGNPVIRRLPKMNFVDDKVGKPIGINRYIGKKPVFAGGNADADLQMLQWANSNSYKNFQLYVHHTDSIREWAYDKDSHVGTLDKGLTIAEEKGWTVASMKDDWKVIYPYKMDEQ
ncbi:HAD family hydrolase [Xanthomarina sp. F2636L]|uniref:HAD family hydrolase n=1 Tax=Xanthomarina sp. F2636L TaxID=2996018 RepID=UPI00225E3840|nr:HAD family hydrolase [Xanthomarina sp. F2636L]MCX7549471.1 HAD family hydrolase [Xanthomarina sp. F2636L]